MLRTALLSLLFFPAFALAGEYNETLKIGDAAPAWKDLPGTDSQKHSLADFAKQKLVVVAFTCNSCPIASDYEDRLIALAKKYSADVAFVAINVNQIADDNLAKMKERAEKKSFPYPYLFDSSQKIAKDYGALFTPEFYVLNADRKIVYMGGLDDENDPAKVKTQYLDAAIAAALKGEAPAKSETLPRGCRIRYARERR